MAVLFFPETALSKHGITLESGIHASETSTSIEQSGLPSTKQSECCPAEIVCPGRKLAKAECPFVDEEVRSIPHRPGIAAAGFPNRESKASTTLSRTPKSWHPMEPVRFPTRTSTSLAPHSTPVSGASGTIRSQRIPLLYTLCVSAPLRLCVPIPVQIQRNAKARGSHGQGRCHLDGPPAISI